jgi:hypothetical protein
MNTFSFLFFLFVKSQKYLYICFRFVALCYQAFCSIIYFKNTSTDYDESITEITQY